MEILLISDFDPIEMCITHASNFVAAHKITKITKINFRFHHKVTLFFTQNHHYLSSLEKGLCFQQESASFSVEEAIFLYVKTDLRNMSDFVAAKTSSPEFVSKMMNFVFNNDELCINIDGSCIENDEFWY